MKQLFYIGLFLMCNVQLWGQHSVAREWNEVLLHAIRNDFARPTVHARNLYHVSAGMYDAWAAFDNYAKTVFLDVESDFESLDTIITPEKIEAARAEAISYAAYNILLERFKFSPGGLSTISTFDSLMLHLGYDPDYSPDVYDGSNPADVGVYIAKKILFDSEDDGSNEFNDYENLYYEPINEPLIIQFSGNEDVTDPNRWQPLTLRVFIDQAGIPRPISTPDFLSPEWGQVTPFALEEKDLTIYQREGFDYWVYHDPGPPPYLDTTQIGGLSEEYKWGFALVAAWASHLDPADSVFIDISPGGFGNTNIRNFPETMEGLRAFYDYEEGGDFSSGHDINPHTGQPYPPNLVPRGDYTRVLAEFWADGPDSETPPGHWYTILNYVVDHPMFERKYKGTGEIVDALEWDVKSYLMLGGAMHDAAISAWGVKGWYDYIRPVSAIRFMAELGQSTDTSLANYHPGGFPLIPGFSALVEEGERLAGRNNENVGKVKIYSWRGPGPIVDPETDKAGVGWILAKNWWPYQRPTFVTPPFAGYVSGHSTYSRAAAEILTHITGDPFFPGGVGEFIAEKNEFLVFEEGPSQDIILQWATYRDASDQTSLSRIWGGIHPPADDIPGRIIGEKVAFDAIAKAESYFFTDADQDGFFDFEDCNDLDSTINPMAEEVLDAQDNNCDGFIDNISLTLGQRTVVPFGQPNVFPNPVEESLNVVLDEKYEDGWIMITNLQGVILSQQKLDLKTARADVDMSNYEKGIYILKITDDQGMVKYVEKIIK